MKERTQMAFGVIIVILLLVITVVVMVVFIEFEIATQKLSELMHTSSNNGIDQQGWLNCVQSSKTVAECDQEFLH